MKIPGTTATPQPAPPQPVPQTRPANNVTHVQRELQARLVTHLNTRIVNDKHALVAYEHQAPGYQRALNEYHEQLFHALKEAGKETLNLAFDYLVEQRIAGAGKKIDMGASRTTLIKQELEKMANSPILANAKGEKLRELIALRQEISKVSTTRDLLIVFQHYKGIYGVYSAASGDGRDMQRFNESVLAIIAVTTSIPGVEEVLKQTASHAVPLIKYGQAAINYAYASTEGYYAWQNIKILVDTRRVEAATALSSQYKRSLQGRRALEISERYGPGGPYKLQNGDTATVAIDERAHCVTVSLTHPNGKRESIAVDGTSVKVKNW